MCLEPVTVSNLTVTDEQSVITAQVPDGVDYYSPVTAPLKSCWICTSYAQDACFTRPRGSRQGKCQTME